MSIASSEYGNALLFDNARAEAAVAGDVGY
jgi:hypothetical protein